MAHRGRCGEEGVLDLAWGPPWAQGPEAGQEGERKTGKLISGGGSFSTTLPTSPPHPTQAPEEMTETNTAPVLGWDGGDLGNLEGPGLLPQPEPINLTT